jgi:hypothetical protein
VIKFQRVAVLLALVASAEARAQRVTTTQQRSDEFSAVRCDSDVVKALVGRRVRNGRVVVIERAHADIALKDLGASEISESLWFISWGMCGRDYSLLQARGRVADAILVPAHSRRYPEFLGWCTRGQDTIEVVHGVLDNPAWRPPGQPVYLVGDSTMLRAITAWKIDERSRRFVPIDITGLRCARSGMFSADGGM